MIFDIIIGTVVVMSMVIGFRSGIMHTLFNTLGWIVTLPAAFVLSPRLEIFLEQNTDIYLSLQQSLTERFTENAAQRTAALDALPHILSDAADRAAFDLASSFAQSLSDALFSILCFVIVIVAAKALIWLVTNMFSKKHASGFTGLMDGSLGMCIGFVRGILLAFILLTLLVPLMGMSSHESAETMRMSLDNSSFAGMLYDNNLLLLIIQDLF